VSDVIPVDHVSPDLLREQFEYRFDEEDEWSIPDLPQPIFAEHRLDMFLDLRVKQKNRRQ
jgi:hypothetical protein